MEAEGRPFWRDQLSTWSSLSHSRLSTGKVTNEIVKALKAKYSCCPDDFLSANSEECANVARRMVPNATLYVPVNQKTFMRMVAFWFTQSSSNGPTMTRDPLREERIDPAFICSF